MTGKSHQVFSIRFTLKELETLRALADREKAKGSEIIRAALAAYSVRPRRATIDIAASPSARFYIYEGGPPPTKTGATAMKRISITEEVLSSFTTSMGVLP